MFSRARETNYDYDVKAIFGNYRSRKNADLETIRSAISTMILHWRRSCDIIGKTRVISVSGCFLQKISEGKLLLLNFQFYPHICRIEFLVMRLETMRHDKIIAIINHAIIDQLNL